MASSTRITCIRILQNHSEAGAQKLAEACHRFTPQIALRGKDVIFLDISKSLSLFSEPTLKARISFLAKRLGLSVRITFASHLNISLAKSYFPLFEQTENFSLLPIEACLYFLEEHQEVQFLIKMMKPLGIQTMADFLALPPEGLGSRFGKTATSIHSTAQGLTTPAWKGFSPSLSIEESMELGDEEMEGTEITFDPLLFSLKTLIDRAMTRIIGLGQRASKIQIVLRMVPWSTLSCPEKIWELSLPIPQGTSMGILPILREYLSFELSRTPLLAPVKSIRFKILVSTPGHGAQKDLFHSRESEGEIWDQLLARLLSQLGEGYVFHAILKERYCPEQSWMRTLVSKEPTKHIKSCNFLRPSRLLRNPEPLQIKPSLLILPNGIFFKVKRWEGPERISTAWWEKPSSGEMDRDYYLVETYQNERLWIFFDRRICPPQPYLHGFFD